LAPEQPSSVDAGVGAALTTTRMVVNPRVRWVHKLREWPDLFDVGITQFYEDGGAPHTGLTGEPVLDDQWARFKYLLNLDGNGYSARTAFLACTNSTLIAGGIYEDMLLASLTNMTNVVFASPDGSDIHSLVQWLREHDDQARMMGASLYDHFKQQFTIAGLGNYTTELLVRYSQAVTMV